MADSDPVRARRGAPSARIAHIDRPPGNWAPSICFARSPPEARRALAAEARDHLFAAGEAIVRQGAAGDSMFVILTRPVRVILEPSGQEVALIAAGGFFGEMSMLTGDPRTATVRATADVAGAGDCLRRPS